MDPTVGGKAQAKPPACLIITKQQEYLKRRSTLPRCAIPGVTGKSPPAFLCHPVLPPGHMGAIQSLPWLHCPETPMLPWYLLNSKIWNIPQLASHPV